MVDNSDHWRERFQREQRLRQGLRIVADRLDVAERERTSTIAAAHRQGLSVRKIAAAVRLSPARVHQLLHAPGAATSIAPLVLRDGKQTDSDVPAAVAAALLRECIDWLERLDRGQLVVVNPGEPAEHTTEDVVLDRPQVHGILLRLARDLEDIAAAGGFPREGSALSRREYLADLAPTPPLLSPHEERRQLRRQLGLDP